MNHEQYLVMIQNLEQIIEALGCVNRLYFYEYFQRDAVNDEELLRFYIKQGGADNYRRKENERKKQSSSQDEVSRW
jgi:hypothetical protein